MAKKQAAIPYFLVALAATGHATGEPLPQTPTPGHPLSDAGPDRSRESPARHVTAAAVVEMGFVDPIRHTIQFGKGGTRFDYVADGGQDVLFPTMRLSAEMTLAGAHTLIFLYQPLDLRTRETLREELVVDDVSFPAQTPVDFRYGFDFYRASYLYDWYGAYSEYELSLGGGLQLRNAVIDFTSADGQLRRSNRDVGPVPLLKARARSPVVGPLWLGAEVDGMYAPVKYVNGGRSDVVGAILDASVRVGAQLTAPLGLFLNVRYLGGGAKGTSKADAERGPGDGYTSNWLHFWTATIGARAELDTLLQGSQ
jgi:hypothetical protein